MSRKRVEFYAIKHYPNKHNFIISPKLIHEESLKFIYEQNGEHIEKIVPVKVIGPFLVGFPINKWDEDLREYQYKGFVYAVNEKIIFKY